MSRLQANQRRTVRPERALRSLRVRSLLLTMLAVLLIAACADDSGERQFATDPRTPKPTEKVVAATPAGVAPADRDQPQASPETLVDRRGAPQVIYGLFDGTLWAFGEGGQRQVTTAPVAAFDASPSGHLVATVTSAVDGNQTTYDIAVFTPEGEVDQRFERVLTVETSAATPRAAATIKEAVSISWAPQGRHLLLAHPSGRLIDVSLDGEQREIEARVSLEGLVQADWSPRGDTIGVVFRGRAGNGQLALIDPAGDPAGVNVIAPVGDTSGTERSVESFAWKAHGDGVLFLEGTRSDTGVTGGRVVSWEQATNATRVVATGGQAGPTGSVMSFDIAPDGKAVAYSIWLPTPDGWSFNGIYVRSTVYGEVYRVPIDTSATVIQTWWYTDGLAWALVEGVPDEVSTIEVRMIDGNGERHQLGEVTLGPSSTPMASPVATPGASPVAVDGTPVSIPVQASPAA